jgi:hypothetical protein
MVLEGKEAYGTDCGLGSGTTLTQTYKIYFSTIKLIDQASWINSSTRTQTHTAPASSIEASRIHKAANVPGTLHAHKAAQHNKHKQRTVLGPNGPMRNGCSAGRARCRKTCRTGPIKIVRHEKRRQEKCAHVSFLPSFASQRAPLRTSRNQVTAGNGYTRAAMTRGAEGDFFSSRHAAAKTATCRRDAEEDVARGRRKRVRWEHAHDACFHRGCCNAQHLPNEALCRDDVPCAPQAKKLCAKEAKIAPKLRAQEWPLRAAAKLPVPKRKITVEV